MASVIKNFLGINFPNPLILPSGIAQNIPADHLRAINGGAGGITTKSLTVEVREGNPLPRIAKVVPEGFGIINSVGLKGPGLVEGKKLIQEFLSMSTVPVIVSIFASKIVDFEKLTEELIPLKIPMLELNLSCPNVDDEFGKPIGLGRDTTSAVIKAVKKISGTVPLIAKLSPNVTNIGEIAKSCEDAGADGIAAVNTLGPGMTIDIQKKKPVIGAKKGGISGRIILPIAVRCVFEIYEAVKIPIIGIGGVSNWQDAVEMFLAGASLVGVGSATYYQGMDIFRKINSDLESYMNREKLNSIDDLIGLAHK